MTKKLFNAIDPDALFLLTNRLEEENEKLKSALNASDYASNERWKKFSKLGNRSKSDQAIKMSILLLEIDDLTEKRKNARKRISELENLLEVCSDVTARQKEKNKKLKEQLTVSEEQRALLSDLNKEQERTITSLVEEVNELNIKMAQN